MTHVYLRSILLGYETLDEDQMVSNSNLRPYKLLFSGVHMNIGLIYCQSEDSCARQMVIL